MYLCVRVRVRVYVWGRHSWEKREKKEIRTRKERVKKRVKKRIHKLVHTDKQTDRQTNGRTDRHKSFIDMRYNTEQHSKSNSIKEKRKESNRIQSVWNKVE